MDRVTPTNRKQTRSEKLLASITKLVHINRPYQNTIGRALSPNFFRGFDETDVAAQKRVAKRRAANKVARASRKANRK